MEKARQDKRKGLQSRLDFGDTPKRARRIRSDSLSSGDRNSPARYCYGREKSKTDARRKNEDMSVFNRLSHRKRSAFERLSNTYSLSTTKSGPSNTTPRDRSRGKNPSDRAAPESEATSAVSKSLMAIPTPPRGHSRSNDHHEGMKKKKVNESPSSRASVSSSSHGTHQRPRRRRESTDEEDLDVPWTCEDV
ncbi:hypothetical protein Tco_1469545, partial [Tanacetum coccineum]